MAGIVCGSDWLQDCMVERAAVPPCEMCIEEGARGHPCTKISTTITARAFVGDTFENACFTLRDLVPTSSTAVRQRLVARQHGRRAVPPCAMCTEETARLARRFPAQCYYDHRPERLRSVLQGRDCCADRCELHFHKVWEGGGPGRLPKNHGTFECRAVYREEKGPDA